MGEGGLHQGDVEPNAMQRSPLHPMATRLSTHTHQPRQLFPSVTLCGMCLLACPPLHMSLRAGRPAHQGVCAAAGAGCGVGAHTPSYGSRPGAHGGWGVAAAHFHWRGASRGGMQQARQRGGAEQRRRWGLSGPTGKQLRVQYGAAGMRHQLLC